MINWTDKQDRVAAEEYMLELLSSQACTVTEIHCAFINAEKLGKDSIKADEKMIEAILGLLCQCGILCNERSEFGGRLYFANPEFA